MPRIPDASQLDRSVPQSRRAVVEDHSGEIIGNALTVFAANRAEAAKRNQGRQDLIYRAQSRNELSLADNEERKKFENDPDWATQEDRYTAAMTPRIAKLTEQFSNPEDRALFETDAKVSLAAGALAVARGASAREASVGLANLAATESQNREQMLTTNDADLRNRFSENVNAAVSTARDLGYLSPEAAAERFDRWRVDAADGYVDTLPAERQVQELTNPAENSLLSHLPADRRAVRLKQAQRELDAERGAKSTEARQAMNDHFRDMQAAAQIGLPVEAPDRENLVALYGDQEGGQRFKTAQRLAKLSTDVAGLQQLPTGDLVAKVQSYAPKAEQLTHDGYPARQNADGSRSTEVSITVTDERLNGGKPTNIPSLWRGVEVPEDQAVENALATGKSWQSFDTIGSAEAAAKARSAAGGARRFGIDGVSEQSQMQAALAGSVRQIVEHRQRDPAGYLVEQSPVVGRAWEAMSQDPAKAPQYLAAVRAEKERLGIPGRQVLPEGYAAQVADDIATGPAEKMADRIEEEANRWGSAWPQVYGQLAGKLPDTAAVIGSGIPKSAATALASMSGLKSAEIKALLPQSVKPADVDESVGTQFEEFVRSMPAEAARTTSATLDAANRLTTKYIAEGANRTSAARRAYQELVGSQYELRPFRGAVMRLPAGASADAIEAGAGRALERFEANSTMVEVPAGSTQPSEVYQERLQSVVRARGYWLTNPSSTGLRLYVDGRPVESLGNPVDVPWQALAAGSIPTVGTMDDYADFRSPQ